MAETKIMTNELLASILGGWLDVPSITRVSDVTATIPGDWTAILGNGNPFRWLSNGALRQNWVISATFSSPNTTITITPGFASAANDMGFKSGDTLTVPQFSHNPAPAGFPFWLYWTPTLSSTAGTVPTYTSEFRNRFRLIGRSVRLNCLWRNTAGGTAGSGGNVLFFTPPVSVAAVSFGTTESNIGNGFFFKTGLTEQVSVAVSGVTNLYFRRPDSSAVTPGNQDQVARNIMFNSEYEF